MNAQDIVRFNISHSDSDAMGVDKVGSMPSKFRPASSAGKQIKVSLSVVRAASAFVEITLDKYTLLRNLVSGGLGLAIYPTKTKKTSPAKYYVGEFHHADDYTYLVAFSIPEKKLYFSKINSKQGTGLEKIVVPGKKKQDGSASSNSGPIPTEYVLATLWEYFAEEPEFHTAWMSSLSAEIKNRARAGTNGTASTMTNEELTNMFALLSDNIYYRIKDTAGNDPFSLGCLTRTPQSSDAEFFALDEDLLDSLEITSVIGGSFSVFKNVQTNVVAARTKADEEKEHSDWFKEHCGKYRLNTNRVLTTEEKALVPTFDTHYTPNKNIARIAKIVHATPSMRDLEFCGPAGGGKSVGAKMLAFMLGVPYRVFTCSPGLDESDLFGHYTPSTTPTTARNLSSATYKKCALLEGESLDVYTVARKILNYPDLDMLKTNPRFVYEFVTGQPLPENKKLTAKDVMLIYFNRAVEERDKLIEEIRGKSEKSLVFVKSPIVKALENGDLVEVQEQNALSPGTLLGFNDLRDRTSSGYQLPNGEMLYRHPDSVIVMTSNVEYEGCRPMNSSVVSRTGLSVSFPALSASEMAARAAAVTGFKDMSALERMAGFILEIKNAMSTNAIDDASDIGVRELINWCYASMAIGSIYHACIDTVINKASYLDENRQIFYTLLDNSCFFSTSIAYDEEAF